MLRDKYKNANRRKVVTLTKRVKGLFKLGFFKKPSEEQNKIMEDVGLMTLGMIEFLLRDDWRTLEQYLNSIDCFLSFESKTFDYVPSLKYSVGNMKTVSDLIHLQHEIINLRENLKNL